MGRNSTYAAAMVVANVCCGLGATVERVIKPNDASAFRRTAFMLGFAFSVALPFTVPAAVLWNVLTAPKVSSYSTSRRVKTRHGHLGTRIMNKQACLQRGSVHDDCASDAIGCCRRVHRSGVFRELTGALGSA
jgi:hypothetical protein